MPRTYFINGLRVYLAPEVVSRVTERLRLGNFLSIGSYRQ
jgi:hypothetical protein